MKYNSDALKQRHRKVYEDFFAEHDTIVSCGMGYELTPGLAWRVGAPTIYHKLPVSGYIGIKPNNTKNTVEIGKLIMYDSKSDSVVDGDYDLYPAREESNKFFTEFIKSKYKSDFEGVKLDFFFEKPHSWGFDGAVDFASATALYLYFGISSRETLNKLSRLSSEEINNKKTAESKLFDEIQRISIKLTAMQFHGCADGSANFSNAIYSESPIVYVSEERAGSVDEPYKNLKPIDVSKDYNKINDMHYWTYRLEDFAGVKGQIPFDVVSIHPRTNKFYTSSSEFVARVYKPGFEELKKYAIKLFSGILLEKEENRPIFLKNLEQKDSYWQEYIGGQTHTRLRLLKGLIEVYQDKFSSAPTRNFLELLSSSFSINTPLDDQTSRNLRRIISDIKQKADIRGVNIGIRCIFWGKQDGNIIVFAPPFKFRDEFFEVIENLQKNYNSKIHIDYASWREGNGKDGIKIEQCMSRGIYSEFINKDSVHLTEIDGENRRKKIMAKSEIDAKQFDLLVDLIANEVFINGNTFTSKEIPSKKATIALMAFLSQNTNTEIMNDALPDSPYKSYRNDLQGKIIGPLEQLIRERTGKSLGIKIRGQLKSFLVRFNPNEMKIGLIRALK